MVVGRLLLVFWYGLFFNAMLDSGRGYQFVMCSTSKPSISIELKPIRILASKLVAAQVLQPAVAAYQGWVKLDKLRQDPNIVLYFSNILQKPVGKTQELKKKHRCHRIHGMSWHIGIRLLWIKKGLPYRILMRFMGCLYDCLHGCMMFTVN